MNTKQDEESVNYSPKQFSSVAGAAYAGYAQHYPAYILHHHTGGPVSSNTQYPSLQTPRMVPPPVSPQQPVGPQSIQTAYQQRALQFDHLQQAQKQQTINNIGQQGILMDPKTGSYPNSQIASGNEMTKAITASLKKDHPSHQSLNKDALSKSTNRKTARAKPHFNGFRNKYSDMKHNENILTSATEKGFCELLRMNSTVILKKVWEREIPTSVTDVASTLNPEDEEINAISEALDMLPDILQLDSVKKLNTEDHNSKNENNENLQQSQNTAQNTQEDLTQYLGKKSNKPRLVCASAKSDSATERQDIPSKSNKEANTVKEKYNRDKTEYTRDKNKDKEKILSEERSKNSMLTSSTSKGEEGIEKEKDYHIIRNKKDRRRSKSEASSSDAENELDTDRRHHKHKKTKQEKHKKHQKKDKTEEANSASKKKKSKSKSDSKDNSEKEQSQGKKRKTSTDSDTSVNRNEMKHKKDTRDSDKKHKRRRMDSDNNCDDNSLKSKEGNNDSGSSNKEKTRKTSAVTSETSFQIRLSHLDSFTNIKEEPISDDSYEELNCIAETVHPSILATGSSLTVPGGVSIKQEPIGQDISDTGRVSPTLCDVNVKQEPVDEIITKSETFEVKEEPSEVEVDFVQKRQELERFTSSWLEGVIENDQKTNDIYKDLTNVMKNALDIEIWEKDPNHLVNWEVNLRLYILYIFDPVSLTMEDLTNNIYKYMSKYPTLKDFYEFVKTIKQNEMKTE